MGHALLALGCPGEARERLVFGVADDQLDLGVLAVLAIDLVHQLDVGW